MARLLHIVCFNTYVCFNSFSLGGTFFPPVLALSALPKQKHHLSHYSRSDHLAQSANTKSRITDDNNSGNRQ